MKNFKPSNTMQARIQDNNPFSDLILEHFTFTNPKIEINDKKILIDRIASLLINTKNVRLGPVPSIEAQYRMRRIIDSCFRNDMPIPILIPWGSVKSDFSAELDICELHAMSTIVELNKAVKEVYPLGLDVNVRIEDWSGVELFKLEEGFDKSKSWTYSQSMATLAEMCGFNPKRESEMFGRENFYDRANKNSEAVFNYLKESGAIHHHNPVNLESFKKLKELGWRGIISKEQREHYLSCYRNLYQDWDEDRLLQRLSLYFGGSLARFQLGMTGTDPLWGGDFIQISFVPPIKGLPEGYNDNYLYYRTIPMNNCRSHAPAWRARGYLLIGEDNSIKSKLTTFNNIPDNLETSRVILEEGLLNVSIRADYLL